MADPIIPIKNLSTQDVLYGDRTTTYRWEVLTHPPVRRNLILNPSARVSTQGVGAVGAGATLGVDPDYDIYASTNTADQGAGTFGLNISGLLIGVDIAPNTKYTYSANIYSSAAGVVQPSMLYVNPGAGGVAGNGTFSASAGFTRRTVTFISGSSGYVYPYVLNGYTTVTGQNLVAYQEAIIELSSTFDASAPYFDGRPNNVSYFEGAANYSPSFLVPITDQLLGTLDGVSDGTLTWIQNAAVKGTGKAQIVDLDTASTGMLRVADLKLASVRIRPVCVIQGLPENPLGIFLVSAAEEQWQDTGRVWSVELLDRCTVPSQDVVDQSYAVPAGTLILQRVRSILATAGEYLVVNEASTLATSSGMVWEAGTSKLKIINDLLDVAGYNALWMDGYGTFQTTPRVLPADRPVTYEVLGVARELRDGELSIYQPEWTRNRDSFEVPNKVIAVQAASGSDAAALIGQWTNTDPASPYSYTARGRWIPRVLDSVECPAGTSTEIVAFLQKRAQTTLIQMSAVQAQVKVSHLPIPIRVSDVLRFSHVKAGVDARHVITRIQLDTSPLGLMSSTLQEVISL